MGALLYWITEKVDKKLNSKSNFLIIISFLLLFYFNGIYAGKIGEMSKYLNMIIGFVLIFTFFNLKLKSLYKVDKYMGYYSYPIYLSHFTVLILFSKLTNFGNIENWFKLELKALPFYFILLFAVCAVFVHLIDIKVDHYKNKIKKTKIQ